MDEGNVGVPYIVDTGLSYKRKRMLQLQTIL